MSSAPLFDGLPPAGLDDAANARVVRVALPIPLDRLFDYRVPAKFADVPLPGSRVRVKFSGQDLVGLIVPHDLLDEATDEATGKATSASQQAPRELAAISVVIDEEPVVSPALMRILATASREIFSPIGLALAHALPPGSTPRVARPYALTTRGERAFHGGALGAGALDGQAKPILAKLAEKPTTLSALTKAFPRIDIPKCLASLTRDGLIERRTEHRSAAARIPTERVAHIAPDVSVDEALAGPLARAKRQGALLRQISRAPDGIPTRFLTQKDKNAGPILRQLHARGFLVFEERARIGSTETILEGGERVELTADQRTALVPIRDAIKRQVSPTFLLHGVTGSGKTEVYLRGRRRSARRRSAGARVSSRNYAHASDCRPRSRTLR